MNKNNKKIRNFAKKDKIIKAELGQDSDLEARWLATQYVDLLGEGLEVTDIHRMIENAPYESSTKQVLKESVTEAAQGQGQRKNAQWLAEGQHSYEKNNPPLAYEEKSQSSGLNNREVGIRDKLREQKHLELQEKIKRRRQQLNEEETQSDPESSI